MYNPFSLEGKTIIITGASSGIGRQIAVDCGRAGAKVVAIARNMERLSATLCELEGEGHRCYSYDLSDIDGIGNLVKNIVNDCGKIDGLVCAAGIEKTLPLKLLKPTDYDEVFKVNTISALEMARQVTGVRNFRQSETGGVIFISSITAAVARAGTAAYAASKGALVSAARVLAVELSRRKIRVNCISPGTILTPMMKNYLSTLTEEDYNKRVGGFPLGLGDTTDVSNACVFLLSNASRWITGQNLIIDGGFTAQ